MASSFSKAFAREFGKNTAKLASNLVYGDKWSTPYRRVNPSLEHFREEKIRIQQEQIDLRRQQMDNEVEIERTKLYYALDSAVLENINKLSAIPIPSDVPGLTTLLGRLSIQLKSTPFEKTVKTEETDKKHNREAESRNKYLYALIEKFEQSLFELFYIKPDDPHIPVYAKLLLTRKKEIKKFDYKAKSKKVRTALFSTLVIPFLAIILFWGGVFDEFGIDGDFVFALSLIYVVVVMVSIIVYSVARGIRLKKWINSEKRKYKYTVRYAPKTTNPTKTATGKQDNPISYNTYTSDVFFDLNENNCIGRKLTDIWSKYAGRVNKKYLERRPIFAADGVKDSILYVGVNPDYSEDDDKNFIENEDGKSLLYGSFYQRDDAPGYFKALEFFASHFGKGYSQMNLLYVRENDRNIVMKLDGNFIREQLELSYDTIIKLQPKAIIFFTTFCKDLIFGKGRWVNPDSLSSGHYILNGTNIPVFFTEDITMLKEEDLEELIEKLSRVF